MASEIPRASEFAADAAALPAPGLALLDRLKAKTATVGVIGLGYVGLPLAVTIARRSHSAVGFEIDARKCALLDAGTSYIPAVSNSALAFASAKGLSWTTDVAQLNTCDVIIICVPTPLTAHREPDLSFVKNTATDIAKHLSRETLVVLESTTFPGTTDEVVRPILETSGLIAGTDFFVASSPEREDPGNAEFTTATIPKIVAGDGAMAAILVAQFYSGVVDQVVPVSSTRTAEAVKITENIFRAVNIALVNELKVIYDAMGIDIWEVIDGAATKPFGYMPFYPGPGLGGHCIPIDPFYLTWKAREYGLVTKSIEVAGEINVKMPEYVIARMRDVIDRVHGKGLRNARVLVVGVSYKQNVPDIRESPSLRIMDQLQAQQVTVAYLDPLVPTLPEMRDHPNLVGLKSVAISDVAGARYDAIIIATDHDDLNYSLLTDCRVPIIDTRNAIARRGLPMDTVTKA